MFRRTQQQQPARDRIAVQQQMSGSNDFQAQPQPGQPGADDKPKQMGEGSYEGTREYQKRIQRYLDQADVNADAEKAKPRSEQEARELEQAEKEGKSHSRGES
jgi:hypothetical protein